MENTYCDVMEIHGGDISCVHRYTNTNDLYEICITRYGEMGKHYFHSRESMEDFLIENYDFTEDMIKMLFMTMAHIKV